MGKEGKKKSSQKDQDVIQPQPSTSNSNTNTTSYNTPQVIAPVSPMTAGKSLGLHQGISTVRDHTMKQIPKTQEYPEEIHGILHISGQH